MRSGIDYLGQYRCSARAKGYLSRLGQSTEVVIDWTLFKRLADVGYQLDPERDNKSVWTPEWIETALTRYGSFAPPELIARVSRMGGRAPSEVGSSDDTGNRARNPEPTFGRLQRAGGSEQLEGGWTATGGTATRIRESLAGGSSTSTSSGRRTRRPSGPFPRQRGEVLADNGTRVPGGHRPRGFDPTAYADAKAATLAAAGGRGRRSRVLPMDVVVDKYIHSSHFSGAPYFCRNDDAMECATRDADRIASNQRALDPYVAGRRVQHGPSGPKGRLVWMAPLSATILNTRYAKPAYWGLVGRDGFAYARTNFEIGTFVSALQSQFKFTYCLDFSAFDARLPAWLISDCFDILATHLDMTAEESELFDRLVNDFIHSRLILPDQSIWQVHRGVPSGSAFTSLVDSVANLLIINYVWIVLTGKAPKPQDVMVLGDDSVVGSATRLSLGDIAKVTETLGMVLSVEKSIIASSSDMVQFLGHGWKNSRPHRSFIDLAIRMAFPERWKRRSKRDSYIRAYSFIADAQEGLDLFLSLFHPHSRDVYQQIRDAMWEVGGLSDEVDITDGPGLLRYKAVVEDRTAFALLRKELRLAEIGIAS